MMWGLVCTDRPSAEGSTTSNVSLNSYHGFSQYLIGFRSKGGVGGHQHIPGSPVVVGPFHAVHQRAALQGYPVLVGFNVRPGGYLPNRHG